MKVKTLSRTVSFGNYENISMTCDVEETETTKQALVKLENEIKDLLQDRNAFFSAVNEVGMVENSLKELRKELSELENKKSNICNWAEKYNIRYEAFSELPF